jgi:hypothetical protein
MCLPIKDVTTADMVEARQRKSSCTLYMCVALIICVYMCVALNICICVLLCMCVCVCCSVYVCVCVCAAALVLNHACCFRQESYFPCQLLNTHFVSLFSFLLYLFRRA